MTDFPSRESKSFKTRGGHEIEFFTELTGGEFNEVQRCYLKSTQAEVDPGMRQQVGGVKFSLETQIEAEYKTISFLVSKLDGSDQNVLDRIKNLPKSEYEQIVSALNTEVAKKKVESAEQSAST